MHKVIRTGYETLNLITYLTAGEKEVRAWTIEKGMTAPQAAGVIHSDFERGFIRAEVMSYDDLVACGSEKAVKEKGLLRVEGKDYVVKDGDVMLLGSVFRITYKNALSFFNYRRLILYSLLLMACGLFFLTTKKSTPPTDIQIYQIHTPAYFKEKNFRTFDDFSRNEIKRITDYGFNVIWMTGIWQPSEASYQHNLDQEDPQNPGRIANIYSIPGYQVNQKWGGKSFSAICCQGAQRRRACFS